MGFYDTVIADCPNCGEKHEFQSKSGDCNMSVYTLENCPKDVMLNVNRHSPMKCTCGVHLTINIINRSVVLEESNEL
jgi:hypothetical protein